MDVVADRQCDVVAAVYAVAVTAVVVYRFATISTP